VTGGSSGIGAASVRRLAAAGARVVVGYNRGLDRAKKLLGSQGPNAGAEWVAVALCDRGKLPFESGGLFVG
jgi:NAD(P)-dependent dehydrogenase (short-subunit alcohol dehydrogenase family)